MKTILPALPLLLSLSTLSAQCPFSTATTQTYGTSCSEVFGNHPTLGAALDVGSCTVNVVVDMYGGCCNTFLQGTVLVLGLQQATLPLPVPDPLCAIHVAPVTLLVDLGSQQPHVFSVAIPPALPPLTVYAQGVGLYYTTITFPLPFAYQYSVTPGLEISLR